jgi:ferredoxin
MTYVVTDACIRCKYMDCVPVCPVDCFHEGENMLVIDPDVCIDCGVCEFECPVGAIIPDTAPQAPRWVEHNRTWAKPWPQIRVKGTPPPDADDWKDTPDKMALFDPNPGTAHETL